MTKAFANFSELTSAIAFDVIDAIKAADWGAPKVSAKFGASGQSCSAYVTVDFTDADGDYFESEDGDSEFKIRFSDHADRHGSDITFRIDDIVTTTVDECGEYRLTHIDGADYAAIVNSAVAAVAKFFSSAEVVKIDFCA